MHASPPPQPSASHPLTDDSHRADGARRALRSLGMLSTSAAAMAAEALFCRTTRARPHPDEVAFLAQASTDHLRVLGHRIVRYQWGDTSAPLVMLVHGWGSHAGRFAALGRRLLDRGHRVAAFDAPGHGRSGGWRATMPEFARTLRAVADATGQPHALVGHSLGGAASIFAASHGLRPARLATVAAPADITQWATRFRELVDLDPSVYAIMRRNLTGRLGVGWHDLDLEALASRLAIPGLIVHDHDDIDVPVHEAETLATRWPGATLERTRGLGHRRILRDEGVVERIVEFVAGQNGLTTTNQAATPPSTGQSTSAGRANAGRR